MSKHEFKEVLAERRLTFNEGQILRLTAKQANGRLHTLRCIKSDHTGAGVYSVKGQVEFKIGEVIEVAESTPMTRRQRADNTTPPAKPVETETGNKPDGRRKGMAANAVDATKAALGGLLS